LPNRVRRGCLCVVLRGRHQHRRIRRDGRNRINHEGIFSGYRVAVGPDQSPFNAVGTRVSQRRHVGPQHVLQSRIRTNLEAESRGVRRDEVDARRASCNRVAEFEPQLPWRPRDAAASRRIRATKRRMRQHGPRTAHHQQGDDDRPPDNCSPGSHDSRGVTSERRCCNDSIPAAVSGRNAGGGGGGLGISIR
jgi:hypothetical protein